MSSQCYPNLEVLPAQMNVFKMSGIIDAFESSRDKKNTADLLWKKYQTLKHLRETEVERLLKEATKLASEERETYQVLVEKLKCQNLALRISRQPERDNSHGDQTRLNELEKECGQLREKVKSLEMQLSKHDESSNDGRKKSSEIQLAQSNKLLHLYRLITSIHIRLIEEDQNEMNKRESCAIDEVSCVAEDSDSGKCFSFELAIPNAEAGEIEYLPEEQREDALGKIPSYLKEELSFKRSELTKFMRTILEVVSKRK